jgi:hypothetical protein
MLSLFSRGKVNANNTRKMQIFLWGKENLKIAYRTGERINEKHFYLIEGLLNDEI